MEYPIISDARRLELLECPDPDGKLVDIVLDTDTFNEIDDQFAIAWSLLSPDRINCHAIYAAPFYNQRSSGPEDGMVKSYEEILRLLDLLGHRSNGFAFEGSRSYLPKVDEAVVSPAADDIVAKARNRNIDGDGPLYVVAIGAITNIASAILVAPDIIDKIVVVWVAGQPHYWHTARDFNLSQDLHAARAVLESGVPFVHVPAMHVSQLLRTTVPELRECIAGKSKLADFLFERFCGYSDNHFAWSKEIWDLAPLAWLMNPSWLPTAIVRMPLLTDQYTWSVNYNGHFARVALDCKRDAIFNDLFKKLV